MNAVSKALASNNAMINTVHDSALQMKNAGVLNLGQDNVFSSLSSLQEITAQRRRYQMFSGWLYSAIHALAIRGAEQPICAGRLLGAAPNPGDDEERRGAPRTKTYHRGLLPAAYRTKAARQELEVFASHEILDSLERPNTFQTRWQLTYSFICNINLTGWGYIVFDLDENNRMQFFSVPTSWVQPIHDKGPFEEFKIIDPRNPGAGEGEIIPRENMAFSYLPDPSDPLKAKAPAGSQARAIQIESNIQTSQERFFENGIFPSVVVTVGKDPHPEVPGGLRPRLSLAQRNQVESAIRKTVGGVYNYGNPAIVDGLVESITRLSATSNEMGWDKSEDKVVDRILSAYGVHKFLLGMPVNVGGYAQAAEIHRVFCDRVNVFLDMLSCMMTEFAGPKVDEDERTLIWWEQCVYKDPQIEAQNWREARKNGDISKNEYRAFIGLPPDENDEGIRAKLLDSIGGLQSTGNLIAAMGRGEISQQTVAEILVEFLQISPERALEIVGEPTERQALQEATDELQRALAYISVEDRAEELLEAV